MRKRQADLELPRLRVIRFGFWATTLALLAGLTPALTAARPAAAAPAAGPGCRHAVVPPVGPFQIQADHRTITDHIGNVFLSYGITVPGLSSPTYAADPNFVTNIVISKDIPKIEATANVWCGNTVRIQVSQFDVTDGTTCHSGFLTNALDSEVRAGEASGLAVVINAQTESDPANKALADPTTATLTFWKCVAGHTESWPGGVTYGTDPQVIFDVFNEPKADACFAGLRAPNLALWRNGGTFTGCGQVKVAYVGMNTVVAYLRSIKAQNLLWVEGPDYADTLAGLRTATASYLIADPLNRVVYSIHHPMLGVAAPPSAGTWWKEFGYLVNHPAAKGVAPVVVGEWTNFTAWAGGYAYCLPNAPVQVPAFLSYLAKIRIGLSAYQLGAGTMLKTVGAPWSNTTNYTDVPWKASYCSYTTGPKPPLLGAGQAVLTWFRAQN